MRTIVYCSVCWKKCEWLQEINETFYRDDLDYRCHYHSIKSPFQKQMSEYICTKEWFAEFLKKVTVEN